jgi:hypothetical protein
VPGAGDCHPTIGPRGDSVKRALPRPYDDDVSRPGHNDAVILTILCTISGVKLIGQAFGGLTS